MAGGQERILRRRIRSIQSTMKITRAMELIAASRIVRAQQAIAATRPYVEKMAEVVSHLSRTPEARRHALFREPSSVLRATERVIADHAAAGHEVVLIAVGRRVSSYFRYRNREVASSFTGMADRPTVEDASTVAAAVMAPYEAGDIDQIDLIYTHFESLGRQYVSTRTLVPITPPDFDPNEFVVDYEYEPEPAELLDRLLPSWLQGELLAALLSASAAEYAARQRAMKAATDNADELMTSLTRIMNRARQDSITTEIMEIVGGAEALRSGRASDYTETYEDPDAA